METIDFETWYEENREFLRLDSFSREYQYGIYEGDVYLDINPKWTVAKLNNCDIINLLEIYIIKAKRHNDDKHKELLTKYRKMLYQQCSKIIQEYCF